jgi:DNA-binding transcriptional ArsR family regulator
MAHPFPAGPQHVQTNVQAAAELLRVLANEHRPGVLCALRQGELSVGALLERVGPS